MEMGRANSYEWAGWFGLRLWDLVIDPDGWSRKNLDNSLLDRITLDEFLRRVNESTINLKVYADMLAKLKRGGGRSVERSESGAS